MKRSYVKLTLFLLLMAVFFGGGILLAKMKFSGAPSVQKEVAVVDSQSSQSQANNLNQGPGNVVVDVPVPAESADSLANKEDAKKTGVTFAVIGDTKTFKAGNPNGNLEKAVASLGKQNFDLAFVMGDLVQSCDGGSSCEKKYADWKSVMAPLLSKTYEVQGNHDRTGGDKADAVWQKEFNLPTNGPAGFSELTYSFDVGNSHFVVLTSEKPKTNVVNDVQRAWLEQDLKANKKTNTFVFLHEPAFQMSQDSEDALDAKPGERDQFWNVLKRHNVTAVFNGHLHMVAGKKQDGINQFVIGDTDSTADDVPQKNLTDFGLTGHYYAIVAVDGSAVDLRIYSLDGSLVKDYPFSK